MTSREKGSGNKSKGELWSRRVVIRYSLLQLPELAGLILVLLLIRLWIDLPEWLEWAIVAAWVLKDVVLYPLVWRAYDDRGQGARDALIGKRGIAEERLAPSGYVRVRGELWRAEVWGTGAAIEKGEAVRIRDMEGLTVTVEPWGPEDPV